MITVDEARARILERVSRLPAEELPILETIGRVLDEGWQLKRNLATTISNDHIDCWYRLAREAGALGGKLCGAGGGGFLLFLVPTQRQELVRRAMGGLKEVSVEAEVHGSQVLISQ